MPVLSVSKVKRLSVKILITMTMTGCSLGDSNYGLHQQILSQPLSLSNPDFRTCVFDPIYSIVHFPMYHFPTGHYTIETYEKVTSSQFQLLHSLLAYQRSSRDLSLFDEAFISDIYNETYFRALSSGQNRADEFIRIDNQVSSMGELFDRAHSLFGRGIPKYYEHLSASQKDFLFHRGASLLLYLLGDIPKIHKVISSGQFEAIKRQIQDLSGQFQLTGNEYAVYTQREQALKLEVLKFYSTNYHPGKLIFITYGASHDFSDEFRGYPFQSGKDLCLEWEKSFWNYEVAFQQAP